MKIDLRKLYGLRKLDVDDIVIIPKSYYENTTVKDISEVGVKGLVTVNYDNNVEINLNVNGVFTIPCSITFEDVLVPFNTKIETEIEENALNNDFFLDLLDILWENIVLEIPFNVIKEGAELKTLSGEGWKLEKE